MINYNDEKYKDGEFVYYTRYDTLIYIYIYYGSVNVDNDGTIVSIYNNGTHYDACEILAVYKESKSSEISIQLVDEYIRECAQNNINKIEGEGGNIAKFDIDTIKYTEYQRLLFESSYPYKDHFEYVNWSYPDDDYIAMGKYNTGGVYSEINCYYEELVSMGWQMWKSSLRTNDIFNNITSTTSSYTVHIDAPVQSIQLHMDVIEV